MTDHELTAAVERAHRRGDTSTVLQLLEPRANNIAGRYYAPGLTHDDLAQEARFGLLKAIRDYQPGHALFIAFATLCMKRQVITAIVTARRSKHGPLNTALSLHTPAAGSTNDLALADVITTGQTTSDIVAAREDLADFITQADRLTTIERHAVVGTIHRIPLEETARRTGSNRKAVDNALQRARRKLAA